MKHLLLVTTALLFKFSFTYCQGQDTILVRRPATNIQQLAEKIGTVIKQEFIELEPIASLSFTVMTVEEISSHKQLKGLRFSKGHYRADYFYHQISYLDSDEISGLHNFLVFAKALATKPDVYTEYHFRSRGDLEIFTASHQKLNGTLTGDWDYYIIVDRNDNESKIQLNKLDFSNFVSVMLKSKPLFAE